MHVHLEIGVPGNVATIVNNTGSRSPRRGEFLPLLNPDTKLDWWFGRFHILLSTTMAHTDTCYIDYC